MQDGTHPSRVRPSPLSEAPRPAAEWNAGLASPTHSDGPRPPFLLLLDLLSLLTAFGFAYVTAPALKDLAVCQVSVATLSSRK